VVVLRYYAESSSVALPVELAQGIHGSSRGLDAVMARGGVLPVDIGQEVGCLCVWMVCG
jgi:hypothetical protein